MFKANTVNFIALITLGFITLISYQNCAKVNFGRAPSGIFKGGTDPRCQGFKIIPPQDVKAQPGEFHSDIRAALITGTTARPFRWVLTNQLGDELKQVETVEPFVVFPQVPVGEYQIIAHSNDNICADKTVSRVFDGDACTYPIPDPSNSFPYVWGPTPAEPVVIGSSVSFKVENFEKFKSVSVQWGVGTAPILLSAPDVSKPMNTLGQIAVTFRAVMASNNCSERDREIVNTFVVQVRRPDCPTTGILVTHTPEPGTIGQPVQFSISNYSAIANKQVQVDFGDGTALKSFTNQNPITHIYQNKINGTKPFVAKFTGVYVGCEQTVTTEHPLSLQCIPTFPTFSVTPSAGPYKIPATVNYTISNFGNGVSNVEVSENGGTTWSPVSSSVYSKTFTTVGSKVLTFRAKVFSPNCDNSKTETVTVSITTIHPDCVANDVAVTAVPNPVNEGTQVSFNISNYTQLQDQKVTVNFGDGSPEVSFTNTNPITHTYDHTNPALQPQTYQAVFKAIENACKKNLSTPVSIGVSCVPQYDAFSVTPSSGPYNAPATVTFNVAGYGKMQSMQFSRDGGNTWQTVTANPLSLSFADAGDFSIKFKGVMNSNNCTGQTKAVGPVDVPIHVVWPDCSPTAGPQVTPTSVSINEGQTVSLQVANFSSLLNGVTVDWKDGSAPQNFTANALTHVFDHPATTSTDKVFNVTVTGTDKECRKSFTKTIPVSIKCVPTVGDLTVSLSPAANIVAPSQVTFTTNTAVSSWDLGLPSDKETQLSPSSFKGQYDVWGSFGYTFTAKSPATCQISKTVTGTLNVERAKDYREITVGETTVKPPIKFFFIIDNSGTMESKQTNLNQYFANIFQNASNYLNGFTATTWVFNTAQYSSTLSSSAESITLTPSWRDGYGRTWEQRLTDPALYDYMKIYKCLNSYQTGLRFPDMNKYTTPYALDFYCYSLDAATNTYNPNTYTYYSYWAWKKYGQIPGDVLGVAYDTLTSSLVSYRPAPTVSIGVTNHSTQKVATDYREAACIEGNSGKPCNPKHKLSYDNFIESFKQRIRVLNPTLYPHSATDGNPYSGKYYQIYGNITKEESAMCAMARILQHSSEYIAPNEQPAFVIFSDEDENDPNGDNCVSTSGTQNYWNKGYCYVPGSEISYETGQTCKVKNYMYRYMTYKYRETNLKYRTCSNTDDSGNCSAYQTHTLTESGYPGGATTWNASWSSSPFSECRSLFGLSNQADVISCSGDEASNGQYVSLNNTSCSSALISSYDHRANYIEGSCTLGAIETYYYSTSYDPVQNNSCAYHVCNTVDTCDVDLITNSDSFQIKTPNITCSTPCTADYCGGSTTGDIDYYVTNSLMGNNCSASNASVVNQTVYAKVYDNPASKAAACSVGTYQGDSNSYKSETSDTYVSRNSSGSRIALKNYIENRINELKDTDVFKPTLAVFVNKSAQGLPAGESVGTKYMELERLINGASAPLQQYAINDTSSYAQVMEQVAQYIRTTVNHAFELNLQPGQTIIDVRINGAILASDKWTYSAGYLRIADTVTLQATDVVRISFYK